MQYVCTHEHINKKYVKTRDMLLIFGSDQEQRRMIKYRKKWRRCYLNVDILFPFFLSLFPSLPRGGNHNNDQEEERKAVPFT